MTEDIAGLDVVNTFNRLRDAFFRYYDTPFGLEDPVLQQERKQLLDRDNGIYRRPVIELRPQYQTTGRSLTESASFAGAPAELEAFAACGLIPPGRELYIHQEQALKTGMMAGRHTAITAGTGSGKTESFLLPIIASLLEESREWSAGAAPSRRWWPGEAAFEPQRSGETGRQAAVRALVLYPMNALVDDQLIRLRHALDSDEARTWLDQNRFGHRFFFGRYTGATPVTGSQDNHMAVGALRRLMRATEKRSAQARKVGDSDSQYFVPSLDGGEMRSRWDMAAHPPDVLITNFSMLNVMLMRARDEHFFASTRKWLENPEHRFTLVIDELHSYRGTAGTEVAFLLRNLLNRLNLAPDSPQLRIMAASASLDAHRDQSYLEEFFGVDAHRFDFLPGVTVRPIPVNANLSAHAHALADADNPVGALEIASGVGAAQALQSAFHLSESGTELESAQAKTESELSRILFPDTDDQTALAALNNLLSTLPLTADLVEWPRLRSHLFFRNVPGIWACIDPNCPDIPTDSPDNPQRRVGRLFAEPVTRCTCGARALELLYCQNCGDILLGGFVPAGDTQKSLVHALLLADVPDLAKLPDQVSQDRTADNFLIYWPQRRKPEVDSLTWDADKKNVKYEFRRSALKPSTGELRNTAQNQDHTGWSFHVFPKRKRDGQWTRDPATLKPFPTQCPSCGDDWEIRYGEHGRLPHKDPRRQRSPIRGMRTGFEKINQVLATELVSQLPTDKRKVIVFTDSRQDAAKLSAGMGLRHYQDLLRILVHEEAANVGDPAADLKIARAHELDDQYDWETVERVRARDLPSYTALVDIWRGKPASSEERAKLELQLSTRPSLHDLALHVGNSLLSMGVNPGGPQASLSESRGEKNLPPKRWSTLFDWSSTAPRARALLDLPQQHLLSKIDKSRTHEVLMGLFSGAGRDFESLGLGWLGATGDGGQPAAPDSPLSLARSSLRILGDLKRFHGLRDGRDTAPEKLRLFWEKAATVHGQTVDDIRDSVLAHWGDTVVEYLINPKHVTLLLASEDSWVCSRCRRQHLIRGAGLCTRCRRELDDNPTTTETTELDHDYYAWKARHQIGKFRLNCEELTGQTDKSDAQSRQARFQEVFLSDDDEHELPDGVDLLSVTTTMEAGVDIGALEAVILGNMPPTRFNYQQRVGRAGRRNSPVAVALTVCRGRSHDEYYFARPQLITNEATPPPYLTLDREEIFKRLLRAEVLRCAFQDVGQQVVDAGSATGLTVNAHGQFGVTAEWTAFRKPINDWINHNSNQITATATRLSSHTPPQLTRVDWLVWIQQDLLISIDEATRGDNGHQDLSQRLAEEGLLPMFGFPTHVRYLHLERPQSSYPWPPRKTIDRDISMAVSSFAPLSEVVRDGRVYPVVGISAFRPGGKKPTAEEDALGLTRHVAVCRSCSHLNELDAPQPGEELPETSCPRCSASPEVFQSMSLREPLGFRAGDAEDFDGNFSWSARAMATRAMTDLEILSPAEQSGVNAFSGPGRRFVINNNSGHSYRFQKTRAGGPDWGGWISLEAVDKDLIPASYGAGDVVTAALGAVQPTDFLFIGPPSPVYPDAGLRLNLDLTARQPSGAPDSSEGRRAAWYSLAFLLRTAAARQLDVQTLEFSAGIYSALIDGMPATMAFIADTLENGAGFSTHLGKQDTFEQLIDGTIADYLTELSQQSHARECSASCYRCLRDYSNMPYHAMLDWRLAADLLTVLRTGNLSPDLERERLAVRKWAEGNDAQVLANLPAAAALLDNARYGKCVVIARHPLEAAENVLIAPRLAATLAEVENLVPDAEAIVFTDTFQLDRDPSSVLTMFNAARN